MRDRRSFLGGAAVGVFLAGLIALTMAPAYADPTQVRGPAEQFCAAINAADGAAVRGVVSDELWARISTSFQQGRAAGSFGTFQVVGAGPVGPGLGKAYLSCRQRDGVEDVVVLTLRQTPQGWKVCGGPTGCTRGNPLGP